MHTAQGTTVNTVTSRQAHQSLGRSLTVPLTTTTTQPTATAISHECPFICIYVYMYAYYTVLTYSTPYMLEHRALKSNIEVARLI